MQLTDVFWLTLQLVKEIMSCVSFHVLWLFGRLRDDICQQWRYHVSVTPRKVNIKTKMKSSAVFAAKPFASQRTGAFGAGASFSSSRE